MDKNGWFDIDRKNLLHSYTCAGTELEKRALEPLIEAMEYSYGKDVVLSILFENGRIQRAKKMYKTINGCLAVRREK